MKQEVMMRTLFFSFLLSAGLALGFASQASAAPANGAAMGEVGQQSGLLLVRDGCGRGLHFSKWRGVCVWDRAPSYRVYSYPNYGYPYGYPAYSYAPYGYPMYGPAYRPSYYGYYQRW
jgi:hypothetical protein